jgi:hypothetical protein
VVIYWELSMTAPPSNCDQRIVPVVQEASDVGIIGEAQSFDHLC